MDGDSRGMKEKSFFIFFRVIIKVSAPLLQDRKPELRSEVMAFRDYLLSSTVSDTLDVWELKGSSAFCMFGLVIIEIDKVFPNIPLFHRFRTPNSAENSPCL